MVAVVGTMKETLPGTPLTGVAAAAKVSPWKLPRSVRAGSVFPVAWTQPAVP